MTNISIKHNVSLKTLTTFKIGGEARQVAEITLKDQIAQIVAIANQQNLPLYILGSGSNTIAHDDGFDGIIALNRLKGIEIISEAADSAIWRAAAGEVWDDFVAKTVNQGYSGIEAMSAIPGTVGAAPVQNIGAYGQELSDVFVKLTAYDIKLEKFVILDLNDCEFSYRNSIFRHSTELKYIITEIFVKLSKLPIKGPFYDSVQAHLTEHAITSPTPADIRQAVQIIRHDKLPDPARLPNAGSFFKNAIISAEKAEQIKSTYPEVPLYPTDNGDYKLSTGWLIEQTGLKGQTIDGIKIHDKNALILINQSATSYNQLAKAREQIRHQVATKFEIDIIQEPLEISTSSH